MKNFLLMLLLSFSVAAVAQTTAIYNTKEGAINGYDPVAYFSENKPVKGDSKFTYNYKGAQWYFSNEKNLDIFKADPEKYMPQYGGYCAYGMSEGYKAPTAPDAFTIADNKLYLNYSRKVQSSWTKNQKELIMKADKKWPQIKDTKPE